MNGISYDPNHKNYATHREGNDVEDSERGGFAMQEKVGA